MIEFFNSLSQVQVAAIVGALGVLGFKYAGPLLALIRKSPIVNSDFEPTPEDAAQWADWLETVGETQAAECMRGLKVSHFVKGNDA